MANISSASGVISFEHEFYQKHKQLVESCLDSDNFNGYYGLLRVESTHDGDFCFDAAGRWSLENTLPWLLKPVLENESKPTTRDQAHLKEYRDLTQALAADNSRVIVEYTDTEAGMQFIVEQSAILTPQKPGQDFNVTITETTNYDYNNENLIGLDFAGGYPIDSDEVKNAFKDYVNDTDTTVNFLVLWQDFLNMCSDNDDDLAGYILDDDLEDMADFCERYDFWDYVKGE